MMQNQEVAERSNSRPEKVEDATYANIAASSWNQNDMRCLSALTMLKTDTTGMLGDFQLFDDMAPELGLVASKLRPNLPEFEPSQAPDSKSDSNQSKIVQSLDGREYMPPPTLLPDFIVKAGVQIWDNCEKPFEGSEKQLMASMVQGNPRAWEDAKSAFPQLAGVSADLMKAYTRNEINHYDRNDLIDDKAAAVGHPVDLPGRRQQDSTLGLSQISPKGVEQFDHRYPQLTQFLKSKGYGPGQEAQALLDPACVPMIVAAKTASIVEDMQKHGIKHPSTEQIAYAYNPDVYSFSENGHKVHKALYQGEIYASKALHWDQQKEYYAKTGDVIAASKHIKNVLQCLGEL